MAPRRRPRHDRGVPKAAAQEPPFAWPFDLRYHEVDALGVVFNMWYLGYCDAAQAAFFAHLGTSSATLNAAGLDVVLRPSDDVVFIAEITYVCVQVAGRAPVPVPEGLRRALQRHAA